jgi:hypothetical protein
MDETEENELWCFWPLRSPEVTPRDLFFVRLHEIYCIHTAMPTDIPDLKSRITEAVTSITNEVLVKVSKNWSIRSTSVV